MKRKVITALLALAAVGSMVGGTAVAASAAQARPAHVYDGMAPAHVYDG